MRHDSAVSSDAPWLVLAHGAGAGHEHPWMRRVAAGLAARGIHVVTFDFPYKAAGRHVPDKGAVLEDAFAEEWKRAAVEAARSAATPPRLFGGGKSMGGRIASQAAARGILDPVPAGLVFFGYPLHPPGKPDQRRDRHLPAITCPMLFLHGTRDPFGTPAELDELARRLPEAALEIIDGGDHSLVRSGPAGKSGASVEGALDLAAAWMLRLGS
jgi:predicted alpha/beta-hydrolase family hydrolase